MGLKRTEEFRKDAVRIALTSGLTRKQVAADLGIGMSTLNKWITAHRDTDVVSKEDLWLAQENERLRREVCILKEERDILKKATQFFASQKPLGLGSSKNIGMRFQQRAHVRLWMSACAGCESFAVTLQAADKGLIWSRWLILENSRASVSGVMGAHG